MWHKISSVTVFLYVTKDEQTIIYLYIYPSIYLYIYINLIYIYRERERQIDGSFIHFFDTQTDFSRDLSLDDRMMQVVQISLTRPARARKEHHHHSTQNTYIVVFVQEIIFTQYMQSIEGIAQCHFLSVRTALFSYIVGG